MKKILNKVIVSLLLVILIFNLIFSNKAFASAEEVINSITSVMGGIVSVIYWPKRIMVTGIAFLANSISTMIATMDGTFETVGFVTPFDIFFNKCKVLDVNFFDFTSVSSTSATYKVRMSVAKWFYIMRFISAAILLVILIYVGIRMAISSVSEEKAKYKKMLFDWACSLGLIFVLQYIATFAIAANSAIINALEVVASTQTGMETAIGEIGKNAVLGFGINSIVSVAVYALIIFQIIGFVIAYFNRMIKTAFLLIISPLIAITYSIDKMGDGKAQAVNNWLKEFIYTILIQPFHCVIYITFISVAFKLLVHPDSAGLAGLIPTAEYNQLANGILAVLCIKFIKDAEEMIRKIFGFKDDNKGTSLAAGLVASTYVLSKSKDLGKSARGMVNFAKENNFLKFAKNDGSKILNRLKDTKLGGKVSDIGSKVGNKATELGKNATNFAKKQADAIKSKIPEKTIKGVKDLAEKGKGIKNSKFSRNLSKAWNSKPVQFMRGRNSLASAVGIAAGLADYASGNTSALQAIGTGYGMSQGADAFLSSSSGTIGRENAENLAQKEKIRQAQIEENQATIAATQESVAQMKEELNNVTNELTEAREELNNIQSEEETTEQESNTSSASSSEGQESSEGDVGENSSENNTSSSEEQSTPGKTRAQILQEKISSLEERSQVLKDKIQDGQDQIDISTKQNEILQSESYTFEDEEAMTEYLSKVVKSGESGELNKQRDAIITEIEGILSSINQEGQTGAIVSAIQKRISARPKAFDLDDAMQRVFGQSMQENPQKYAELKRVLRSLESIEYDSNIYQKTKLAEQMNVRTESIAKTTLKNLT